MCTLLQIKQGNRIGEDKGPESETRDIKSKNTEEGYRKIWVRQRKTGKAQCKSECVNMYWPYLIIPHPPGPVIGCLIKAGDERREVEDRDRGRREG